MPKDNELQKHTLNLRKGDWEELAVCYPEIPTSTIVRILVSRYVDQVKQQGTNLQNVAVEIKL